MGTGSLVAAWLASVAPLGLESLGLLDLGGGSRLALVLVPWLALVGLPRGAGVVARSDPARSSARSLRPLLHALPVLCAAAALDQSAQHAALWRTALPGAGLLVLLAAAAELAQRSELRRALHACAWLVLVPGGCLLAAALTWGAGPGRENLPSAVTRAAEASPLAWGLQRIRRTEAGPSGAAPLLAALVLLGLGCVPLPGRARRRGSAALLLLALPVFAPTAAAHSPQERAAGGRVAFARFELVGPLEELRIDAGAGTTHAGSAGALVRGERRTLVLPVPVSATGAPLAPQTTALPADGTARFQGWLADEGPSAEQRALLARPRPELGPRARGASPALLLWIAAAFAAGLLARRRVLAELGVALGATLVAGAIVVLRPGGVGVELRLVEGVAGGAWLEIVAAGDVLATELGPTSVVLLGSPAARPAVRLGLDYEPGGRVTLECSGETVYVARERAPLRLERGLNAWGDLAEVWTRTGDGKWSAHGAWRMGEALAAAGEERRADPPGWLAAALPLGRSVLLGRAEVGELWVRVLDL